MRSLCVLLVIFSTVTMVLGDDCPNPVIPENGYLSDPYEGGADIEIKYACREGYELDGHEENFCSTSGTWQLTPPLCTAKYSCPEVSTGTIPHATDVYKKSGDGTSYDSVVQVTCAGGYVKDPNVRESKCTTSGTWDPPIPQCVVPMCLIPTDPGLIVEIPDYFERSDDGTRVEQSATAKFSCEENYFVNGGQTEAECLESLDWDQEVLKCEEILCEAIPEQEGRDYEVSDGDKLPDGRIKIGATVTFSCGGGCGYELSGAASVTCEKNGNVGAYFSTLPNCEDTTCPLPAAQDGRTYNVSEGDKCRNRIKNGATVKISCASSEVSDEGGALSFTCGTDEAYPNCPGQGGGLSTTVKWIIGVVVVGLVCLVIIGIIACCCCKNQGYNDVRKGRADV